MHGHAPDGPALCPKGPVTLLSDRYTWALVIALPRDFAESVILLKLAHPVILPNLLR